MTLISLIEKIIHASCAMKLNERRCYSETFIPVSANFTGQTRFLSIFEKVRRVSSNLTVKISYFSYHWIQYLTVPFAGHSLIYCSD